MGNLISKGALALKLDIVFVVFIKVLDDGPNIRDFGRGIAVADDPRNFV